jgi:hypothetical protein
MDDVDVLESVKNIKAIAESVGILAVAPEYGAGELSPQSLKRAANLIVTFCDQIIAKTEVNTS